MKRSALVEFSSQNTTMKQVKPRVNINTNTSKERKRESKNLTSLEKSI